MNLKVHVGGLRVTSRLPTHESVLELLAASEGKGKTVTSVAPQNNTHVLFPFRGAKRRVRLVPSCGPTTDTTSCVGRGRRKEQSLGLYDQETQAVSTLRVNTYVCGRLGCYVLCFLSPIAHEHVRVN